MTTRNPRITRVQPIADQHKLQIEFSNSKTYTLDLLEHIQGFAILKPLEDLERFAQAQIGDWGFDVTWGDDLELAATTLYRLALEQAGEVMPTQAFRQWMSANSLSLTTAAEELGFTRRTITAYSSGKAMIPKHVALACKGWEALNRNTSVVRQRKRA